MKVYKISEQKLFFNRAVRCKSKKINIYRIDFSALPLTTSVRTQNQKVKFLHTRVRIDQKNTQISGKRVFPKESVFNIRSKNPHKLYKINIFEILKKHHLRVHSARKIMFFLRFSLKNQPPGKSLNGPPPFDLIGPRCFFSSIECFVYI